jgi:hypothetical protein
MPAVAEMVTDMAIAIEAARALTYEASWYCDLENTNQRVLDTCKDSMDKADVKARKERARSYKRLNAMLTPMSKYYGSEMCCRVADTAIQVLGGSGYMMDYAAERHLRDARITTIYEGTSQLQIVAAIRPIMTGTFDTCIAEHEQIDYDDPLLAELKQKLIDGKARLAEAIAFAKEQPSQFQDLSARRLVDSAITTLVGHLLLRQATNNERKARVTHRFIESQLPVLRTACDQVLGGDAAPLDEFELLAGPVPTAS